MLNVTPNAASNAKQAKALQMHRQEKDTFFRTNPQSPLVPEQQQVFTGLRYFDHNAALNLRLKPEVFKQKENVKIQTSTGDTRYYVRWCKVRFQVNGLETELTLFLTPGSSQFFVPFMDSTTGQETYGAGRYVEAELLPGGDVHLDFNMAYSPYCAYNEPIAMAVAAGRQPHSWNCPIPPHENRLKVAIHAGEKAPVGAWVESAADHPV